MVAKDVDFVLLIPFAPFGGMLINPLGVDFFSDIAIGFFRFNPFVAHDFFALKAHHDFLSALAPIGADSFTPIGFGIIEGDITLPQRT